MRPSRHRASGIVVLLVATVSVLSAAGAWALQAPARIVIVAGRPSHPPGMHEFRAGAMLLQKALADTPVVAVDVVTNGWPTTTVDGETVDDNGRFDGASAILIYADGGRGHPAVQGDRLDVLRALAARGVGLGFAHYGVEVPVGEPGNALTEWIGGFYEDRFSVNPIWRPEFAQLPDHPVTRGVEPFATEDEWYFNIRFEPPGAGTRVTPILVATPSDDVRDGPYVNPQGPYPHVVAAGGRAETMMWVAERADGGRGLGFTGGHTHANWGNPDQRRVMLNGLLWLAGVDVPAGGVVDAITAADLTTNLDDKPARRGGN